MVVVVLMVLSTAATAIWACCVPVPCPFVVALASMFSTVPSGVFAGTV